MIARRKRFEDEEDNNDRWLISYADFITLLFAFFVVMYATSNINLNKYRAFSSAVVTAFQGNPRAENLRNNVQKAPIAVLKPLPLSHIYEEKQLRDAEKLHVIGQTLANSYAHWIEEGQVHVFQHPHGIRIDIQDQRLFLPGSIEISAEGNKLLAICTATLRNDYRQLRIEGHAQQSSLTLNQGLTSSWEVSAIKAAKVTQTLVAMGMIDKRLSAVGLADTRPLSSSEHLLAHKTNQRISIWILAADNEFEAARGDSDGNAILPLQTMDIPITPPASPPSGPH